MAAQTGFLRCGDITRLSCRLTTQPSAAARASVTCPAKAEDGKGRADGAAVTRIRRALNDFAAGTMLTAKRPGIMRDPGRYGSARAGNLAGRCEMPAQLGFLECDRIRRISGRGVRPSITAA